MGRPRNPRYFPRMKVRGARRKQQAPIQRMQGMFERVATRGRVLDWQIMQLSRAFASFRPRMYFEFDDPVPDGASGEQVLEEGQ